jgi:hypothetical protein
MLKRTLLAIFSFNLALAGLIGPLSVRAAAGSISATASSAKVEVGQNVSVRIRASSDGTVVNTIGADAVFTPDTLKVVSVGGPSVITLYVTNGAVSANTVSIQGGIQPATALSGSSVGTIVFRALKVGTATISIAGSSGIYANDGKGTNILVGRGSATIQIVEPAPKPPTSPPKNANVPPANINLNANVPPANINLNANVPLADTTLPRLSTSITEGEALTYGEKATLVFSAEDEAGIDRYEMAYRCASCPPGEFARVTSPVALNLPPGIYNVVIRAFDKAGNMAEKTLTVKFQPPPGFMDRFRENWDVVVVFSSGIIFLSGILVLVISLLGKKRRHFRR